MNILLINPAFPETFWSYAKVLELLGKPCDLPPLGLLTVASLLPDKYDIRLADLAARELTEKDWDHADVVMLTGMQVQQSQITDLIRKAKARNKTVVVGGPWVFHFPERAFAAGADIVVRGELEGVVEELLAALEAGSTKTTIEGVSAPDLTALPPPKFELLNMRHYEAMGIQFSRGCPFLCEFCDVTLMYGRKVRTKSSEQIITELQLLYELGWRRNIFFVDDNLIGSPGRAKELIRHVIEWQEAHGRPFEFYTQASVNLASDPELIDLMVRAGFFFVFLGIETPDEQSLRNVKKLQNASVDLNDACRTINEAGLEIVAGCIIGFDGERSGADRRLIEFAEKNSIPEMFVTMLQAGPGTALWKRLEQEGRLLPTEFDDNFSSQTSMLNFVPTRPAEQIAEEFIRLYDELYEPENYLRRAFKHLAAMRPSPVKKPFELPYYYEVRGGLKLIFRHGIVYSSRRYFWKYLLATILRAPSRLKYYMVYCFKAEHYYSYRETIRQRLGEQLARRARDIEAAGGLQDGSSEDASRSHNVAVSGRSS